ncbi:MAG: branched-chain amino acid aminotransferase [Bacteroidota bacterium]
MKHNISITPTTNSRLPELDFEKLQFGRTFTDHMFVVDYEDEKWNNPRIVPFGPFEMHPAAMVLHYGQAIFEGMKAFKNKEGKAVFFRPEMHAKRINLSAERMCMPNLPEDLFLEGLHRLVALDQDWIPPKKGSALYIRPYMIAMDEFIGVRPSASYRFIIFCCPVNSYYTKPVKLLVEQEFVRAIKGGVGEAKAAGNYAAALLPDRLAKEKGYDQVMWTEAPEFRKIQEIGTMNIFFVIDGNVVTPKADGAILKGINRDSIIQLLKKEDYTVEERDIYVEELVEAHERGILQEAFGAGTAAVISQVSEITYKDQKMVLPNLKEAKVTLGIKAKINGIRFGDVADTFAWIKPVQVNAVDLAVENNSMYQVSA